MPSSGIRMIIFVRVSSIGVRYGGHVILMIVNNFESLIIAAYVLRLAIQVPNNIELVMFNMWLPGTLLTASNWTFSSLVVSSIEHAS